jgi:hypothetical protein
MFFGASAFAIISDPDCANNSEAEKSKNERNKAFLRADFKCINN